MFRRAAPLAVPLALLIVACGYPPLDQQGGPDSGAGACDASASYGSPTLVEQSGDFFNGTAPDPQELQYHGRLTNEAKPDFLFVSLIDAGITTGTVTLEATDNFGNCGACVLVIAGCGGNCTPYDAAATGTFYMATGGTLKITSTMPTMAGTLTNATFTHVKIDNGGSAPTFVSTPVNDGCAASLASATFTASVTTH